MAVFFGTYAMKIDGKSRVSMPAPFRDALSRPGAGPEAVLMASEGSPVIEGCDRAFVNELAERAYSPDVSDEARDRVLLMLADIVTPTFDPEGRFIIPQHLKAHAGLTDSAAFVGRGRVFQIWNPARFEEERNQAKARLGGEPLSLSRLHRLSQVGK